VTAAHVRRFYLDRHKDISGVSGEGFVAEGIQFTDGTVVLRWLGRTPSLVVWASLADAMEVHGHDGATTVYWLDVPAATGDVIEGGAQHRRAA